MKTSSPSSILSKITLLLAALVCLSGLKAQSDLTGQDDSSNTQSVGQQPSAPIGVDLSNFATTAPTNAGSIEFPVTAQLMTRVLNVLSHKHAPFNFYTESMASAITHATDHVGGREHYSLVPGQEQTIVGWAPFINAGAIDEASTYTVNTEVDSDTTSYLYLNLGVTYESESDGTHINGTKEKYTQWHVKQAPNTPEGEARDYYWFDKTEQQDAENSSLIDNSITGAIWVRIPNAPVTDTQSCWVSGDNTGLTTGYSVTPVATSSPAVTSQSSLAMEQSTAPSDKASASNETWSQWWDQKSDLDKTGYLGLAVANIWFPVTLLPFELSALGAYEAYKNW